MKSQKENTILNSQFSILNSSRPDLEITNVRRPGAYVVTKDGVVPDLNDEAMAKRAVSGQQSAVSKEEKTELNNADVKAEETKSEEKTDG